jgi:hypothetical protein
MIFQYNMIEVTTLSTVLEKHGPMGLMLIISIGMTVWLIRFVMRLHERSEARMQESQAAHLKAMADMALEVKKGFESSREMDKDLINEIRGLKDFVLNNKCKA